MGEPLRQLLPAEPTSAAAARAALGAWLAPLPWPEDVAQDLVFAASEAVANCIDHAYAEPTTAPDAIVLLAREVDDDDRVCVEVTVTDRGRWRDPPADPRFRGRGIAMMRALTDTVTLHHDDDGTTVLLRCWRPGG
ncbi:hypothetical protein GCM10017691_42910 [Pseudonocardia petroleophila]|uniref:ATP-binding protein n=1 Tax=Pseudonocardia petroleophila TaxID=37331 RepID=A0A7G7MB72_9PSEU|nr:ATP-binding protein [Pseudonocardia petroleophila]QNG50033.1 ATP-binding protein [Pseudonocardia petroleophila]